MLGSRSKEFVDDMIECLKKLEEGSDNLTMSPEATFLQCNETKLELFESYGKALLETDFTLAIIYCCIMGMALTIGVFGNLIIMVITAGTRTMNNVGRDFVMNLAVADLCVTAVADPLCILAITSVFIPIGVVKGEKWFQGRQVLCEVVASMCLTACFCAFLSLTLLTINRYMFVCKNEWYHRFLKRPVCITLCVICWIMAFMFEFPNFVGWGGHYFDKKNHQCIWDRTASFSYTLFVSAGLIGGPLVVMGVCFVLVFYKIWSSKMDLYIFDKDDPLRCQSIILKHYDPPLWPQVYVSSHSKIRFLDRMRRVWKESLRTSRTLVIIFIAFVICWTPYAIVIAFDNTDSVSTEVHLFVTLLAHLHSSLNFTIFICTNKNFRHSVYSLFRCGMFKSLSYQSSSDKTSDTYPRSKNSISEIPTNGLQFQKNLTYNYKPDKLEYDTKMEIEEAYSGENCSVDIKRCKF